VRIFVDSNQRAGSSCGASDGTFTAGDPNGRNGGATAKLNPGSNNPNLEVYVYGTKVPTAPVTSPPASSCGADVRFRTSTSSSNVYFFAPRSQITVESSAAVTGAMAGCTSLFYADASSASYGTPSQPTPPGGQATVVPGAWRECAASGTPVESGCNG
jgi:hypothetical protein